MELSKNAISLGIVLGIILLALAYIGLFLGVGMPVVDLLGSLFTGYHATLLGGIIGFVWGLVVGFIIEVLKTFVHSKVH